MSKLRLRAQKKPRISPGLFCSWKLTTGLLEDDEVDAAVVGLRGLLGNMAERDLSCLDGCCPVLFSLPGGFLNVMPYARPMTRDEFARFDYHSFVDRDAYAIPAERKPDSFGWLNNQPVAIDYGD